MISFVIPTLESDIEYLYSCLDSVKNEISINGTNTDEVIVVAKLEKMSEEGFREKIIKRYGELVRCKFSQDNLSVARNIGLKLAKNNIITFLDCDTRINHGYITATLEDFERGYGYVNYSARPLDEEVVDKRRLYYYSRFMNFNQWLYTHAQVHRPYGFCMSVRKDICKRVAENDEVFLEKLGGHGEDAEFGSRYGQYCRKNKILGKYEKKVIVKTSFREWRKWGFWRGGARMIINTFYVPIVKRAVIGSWRN